MAGQTIHYAKDGSRVVLTQLTPDTFRVDDILDKDDPGGAPAVTSPAAPEQPAAPAAASNPKAGPVSEEELKALVAQHAPGGDVSKWQFSRGTTTRNVTSLGGLQQTVTVPYVQWVDRATGRVLKYEVAPGGGSYTEIMNGIDPSEATKPAAGSAEWHTEGTPLPDGTTDNTRPIMARTVNGDKEYRQPDDKELRAWQNAQQMTRNPGGKTDAEIAAEADKNKPTIAPAQAGRPAVQYVPDLDHPGQVTAVPIPGAPEAPAAPEQQLSAPSDQMWIAVQKPGKPPEFVKNPNYIKPSHIMPNPADPTQLINITHDDNGNVISLPVTGQTAIKPADLPVLQTTYGQIAQGLGALAQDLNSRYARGEITEKQKTDAFTAAHQQAATQVAEINSILENSRAVWAGQVTQRGQSLAETQSRRSYASGVLGNALDTSNAIAKGAVGPGAGRDIVGGMAAILGIGKQYAEGMGGFRESPEIPLPAALQQAQGIGLPGYGPAAAPAGPPGAPRAPGGLPAPLLRPPPPVMGAVPPPGAPPPVPLPGMAPAPGAPPPVPMPAGPMPSGGQPGYGDPGFSRDIGARLQGAQGYAGAPVAAGGAGLWDPSQDVQAMLGDGSDPAWAEAVRAAAATVSQPGYAWQRFTRAPSRFG